MDKILEVINNLDPAGLLSMGCPEDEYKPEISEIMISMLSIDTAEELAQRILDVFNRYFAGFFHHSYEDCLVIAKQIMGD
jgi:hypothetical protein